MHIGGNASYLLSLDSSIDTLMVRSSEKALYNLLHHFSSRIGRGVTYSHVNIGYADARGDVMKAPVLICS